MVNPSTAMVVQRPEVMRDIAVRTGFEQWQIEAVIRSLAADMTEEDAWLFFTACQANQLSPFTNPPQMSPVYFRARAADGSFGKRMVVITTIDGFRSIVHRPTMEPPFGGITLPEFCGPDGHWTQVWDDKDDRGPGLPFACRMGGWYRGDRDSETWALVKWSEYAKKDAAGHLQGLWPAMPCNQLAKVCEARLYRILWPQQFLGLHIDEEVPQPTDADQVALAVDERREQTLYTPPHALSKRFHPPREAPAEAVGTVIEGAAIVVEESPGAPSTAPTPTADRFFAARMPADIAELLIEMRASSLVGEMAADPKVRSNLLSETSKRLVKLKFTAAERMAVARLLYFAEMGEQVSGVHALNKIDIRWLAAAQVWGDPTMERLHAAATWAAGVEG